MANHMADVADRIRVPEVLGARELGPGDRERLVVLHRYYLDHMAKGRIVEHRWPIFEVYKA